MYTYKCKYVDFLGKEREEEFKFNMLEAELAEMQLSVNGGMENLIKQIINTKDNARLIKLFKDLVLNAYGEVSADGRRFVKSPELSKAFSETEAYSQLFMSLATDADKGAEFLNGIMPEKFKNQTKSIDVAEAQKRLEGASQPSLLSNNP